MTFNPNEHLIQLQGKDYLPVAWRLCWFRDICPEGEISTELVTLDLNRETTEEVMVWNNELKRKEKVVKQATGFCVFHATVADGKGGSATGTKSEKAASFPDYIEKCETGAVGRALAMLGYGTQFTGDEFDEGERLADAPLDRGQVSDNGHKVVEADRVQPKATPGTEHLTNGDGSPAFPERMKPSDVEKLYSDFWLWTGSDDEGIVRKRWEVWKQSLFKQVIADQDLTVKQGEVLHERLVAAQEKKAAK